MDFIVWLDFENWIILNKIQSNWNYHDFSLILLIIATQFSYRLIKHFKEDKNIYLIINNYSFIFLIISFKLSYKVFLSLTNASIAFLLISFEIYILVVFIFRFKFIINIYKRGYWKFYEFSKCLKTINTRFSVASLLLQLSINIYSLDIYFSLYIQ